MIYKLSLSIPLLMFIVLICSTSCNKTQFLDAKPSSNLIVPSNLQDFQQLLDNQRALTESGALGTLAADEYFLLDDFWPTLPVLERNAYIWAPDLYAGQGNVADWNLLYTEVFYANVVLEGLAKLNPAPADRDNYNHITGSAYFIRAYAFYNLAQVFAPMYDSATATSDLGIPLKMTSDINDKQARSSVYETYNRIFDDLLKAEDLLPSTLPVDNRNRPSRAAAFALMSRIYLSIGDYSLAGKYADSSLQVYSSIIDYNTGTVFSNRNDETLYQSNMTNSNIISYLTYGNSSLIDTNLYALYDSNDLRKSLFFTPNGFGYYNLVNTYDGFGSCFTGLATDECYLIRAESAARSGDVDAAMTDLNFLLSKRYVTGSYIMRSAADGQDALHQILLERRKELFLRGVRFTDLRRLNKEGFNISLTRKINEQTYTLPPNSPLYLMPIPPDEILFSGIAQNAR